MSDPSFTVNGKTLTWEEAQEIYYAVQDVYDREDVQNEVDLRLENGDGLFSREQADDIREHMDEIVPEYRSRLDEDVGNVWTDTLSDTLFRFLNRTKFPELWR